MGASKNSTWAKVRKFFNDLHLWGGLASGLIVIVVCFSGTAYVYNTEIREMASPHLYTLSEPGTTPLPAAEIIRIVEEKTKGKVQSLKIPHEADRSWHVSIKSKVEGGERQQSQQPRQSQQPQRDGGGAGAGGAAGGGAGRPSPGTLYAVNPYTGELLGNVSAEKNGTTEFMRAMFSLHRWLLLDRIEEPIFGDLPNRKLGSYITGTATILFTFGVLTGLVIWFPKKVKSWKQGLKIKLDANWKRINHDLHNTLAFYSLIFLFLMGVTGPQWSFPWYREGLQKALGTYRGEEAQRPKPAKSEVPAEATAPLSIEQYLVAASAVLQYDGDYTVTLPRDSASAVTLAKNRIGFFAPAAADRISLDQYTGSVVEKEIFRDKPFNERVAGSIKALHLGDVYGPFTKILYFIACLIATTLPVTGTLIWINKLKKKRKKARSGKTEAKVSQPAPYTKVASGV